MGAGGAHPEAHSCASRHRHRGPTDHCWRSSDLPRGTRSTPLPRAGQGASRAGDGAGAGEPRGIRGLRPEVCAQDAQRSHGQSSAHNRTCEGVS